MTKPQTVLELARQDAQVLHEKISDTIADAEHATWADVEAVKADITALRAKMASVAEDQSASVKSGILAAIGRLEMSGRLVEDKAVAAKDNVRAANAVMLESANRSAPSLSAAVAAARTKLAHAIEPRRVTS